MNIVETTNTEIEPHTIGQMQALAQSIDPSLPDDHILEQHIRGPKADFYLCYDQGELVGMQSYRSYVCPTPFAPTPRPVLQGLLTYKHPDAAPSRLTRSMSRRHGRRFLGRAWMLQPWVAIAHTPNPRLYHQFQQFFPRVYPTLDGDAPQPVREFIRAQLPPGHALGVGLIDQGCGHLPAEADISDRYRAQYASRSERVNELFFELGLLRREGRRILLSNRQLYIIGVHEPWPTFRHQARQLWLRRRGAQSSSAAQLAWSARDRPC